MKFKVKKTNPHYSLVHVSQSNEFEKNIFDTFMRKVTIALRRSLVCFYVCTSFRIPYHNPLLIYIFYIDVTHTYTT